MIQIPPSSRAKRGARSRGIRTLGLIALCAVTGALAASPRTDGAPRVASRRPPAATAADSVAVWMTTGDRSALLTKQPTLAAAAPTAGVPTITVDGATTYQTMDGFGYTLTGGSAIVINRMPSAARDALLRELFARSTTSLGVSYLRLSIGASDLSATPYTYDEVPAGRTDPTLAAFSIEAERGIRRVDDGVDLERGDVAPDDLDHGT